jgi:hypothetical protein
VFDQFPRCRQPCEPGTHDDDVYHAPSLAISACFRTPTDGFRAQVALGSAT